MTGNISSNICILPDLYYNWVAVYNDGTYLSEINDGWIQSINDVNQGKLQYLRIFCLKINYTHTGAAFTDIDTEYRLDAQTGQFYHEGINISTWQDTCDVRGYITEYRHAKYSSKTQTTEVYARSIVWTTPLYSASLKLYIPGPYYEINRRIISHGNS